MTDAIPLNLALIYGSTREGRFCDTVATWAAGQITRHGGFSLDSIDPARLDLPARHERKPGPAVAALRGRLDRADAFLVVTPEYNHGYPAALKTVIDLAYAEWNAKPVGFVSYGGISGGLRAVEQLRLVFAELHAVAIRDTVSFANPWDRFDGKGRLLDPKEPAKAMAVMLKSLAWWGTVLKEARRTAPSRELAA